MQARWISLFLVVSLLAQPVFSAFAEDPPAAPSTASTESRPPSPREEDDAQTVAVGNIVSLDFDFEPNVVVGSPNLMTAEKDPVNPKQVRLRPVKKGTTDVLIQDQRGKLVRKINFNIITDDLSQKVNALRTLLSDIEGITIKSVDAKIVIDGELIVPRDFDRIIQVQDAYPEVLNLVSLSKISREAIARRMQKEINDDPGGVNVTVRIINDTFFLLGKVDSSADREVAETIAQTYLPEILNAPSAKVLVSGTKRYSIRNLIKIEDPPPPEAPKMVRITYHFMEIGKEFLKSSFFKWTPLLSEGSGLSFGAGTAGGVASNGSFNGTISNLVPKIQSGANGGFARVLFSTVAIGEAGQQIEVVRNDNIPYIEAIVNGVPVPNNVSVGINVKVTPNVVGTDKLRLATTIQFTALAGAGAGGKPRTTATSMVNTVIVNSGDSAALGGLISSDTAKDIDKDPESGGGGGGGDAPKGSALFSLLRSKAFRNKKTQFVVFITPKIITDAAEGTADIKAKILNNSQKKRRRVIR